MSFQKHFFVAVDKLMDGAQNRRVRKKLQGRGYEVSKDIVYDGSAPQACLLDTCVVPSGGKYPVMFYVHGGGFVAGDKYYRRALSCWHALLGYFVVNVNYGLGPDFKCPEPHRHLVSALNWVGENAGRLNLDLSRMVVSGDSAGAYYAAALACICENAGLQQKICAHTNLKFGAAVLNCGVYDMNILLRSNVPLGLAPKILGDIAGISAEQMPTYEWRELCDLPSLVNPRFPSTFLTYAKKDIFCGGQSEALIAALQKNGVYFEQFHTKTLADNHCFSLNWNTRAAKKNNSLTADFLTRFAKGELIHN